MSAEARRRISDAQKARWAKQKGVASSTEAAPAEAAKAKHGGRVRKSGAKRGRRKMSAAARKRISDAQKARWAKQKRATT